MSEVHFCGECNNMTYIHLDEDKNLIHACKSCGKFEKLEDDKKCIYYTTFTKFDTSNVINTNKYIIHDVTLPKIEGNTKPPRSGAFEVSFDKKMVYSKFKTGEFPQEGDIKSWF